MWKGLRVQICISQASSAKYSDMCHTKPLICFSCPYTRCRANTSYDIELNILNDILSEMSIEWYRQFGGLNPGRIVTGIYIAAALTLPR